MNNMRREPEEKVCLSCGSKIIAFGSAMRRDSKKFCSRKCRGIYQTITGLEKRNCCWCQKEVILSGSRKKKGFENVFCSFKCYGMSKRTENYSPNESLTMRKSWDYAKWRKSVFERDKYSCVFCARVGGRLNADHIKPFALFPELRLDVNNGRTLCVECHRKTPTYGRSKSKVQ